MAKAKLNELDTDHDGILTRKELAKQVADASKQGEDAQMIAALYSARKELQKLSTNDDGITIQGLEMAQTLSKSKQGSSYSLETLTNMDLDCDSRLSQDELNKALESNTLTKEQREILENYKKNNDAGDAVKITDMLHYFCQDHIGDETDQMLGKIDFVIKRTQEAQNNGISTLYADKSKDAREGIDVYALEQGVMGDCYFLSSLAAVAHSSPQTIKDMIKENSDGSFTVTFPGAKNEPISVSAVTQAERGMFNGGAEHGDWAAVIEKAYGAYCQKHFWRRTIFQGPGILAQEGAEGGGAFHAKLLHLLTGKDAYQDLLLSPLSFIPGFQRMRDKATTADLDFAVGQGESETMPAVAWQKPWVSLDASDVVNHVYTVLGFDRQGAGGGTVTLYNPWGHKEAITYNQFRKRFFSLSFQTQK